MKHLFFGGIHPKYNKEMSTGITMFKTISPKHVVIPMVQHIGAPCTPLVAVCFVVRKWATVTACAYRFTLPYPVLWWP